MAQLTESQGALVVIIERRDPATLKCISRAGVMMDLSSPSDLKEKRIKTFNLGIGNCSRPNFLDRIPFSVYEVGIFLLFHSLLRRSFPPPPSPSWRRETGVTLAFLERVVKADWIWIFYIWVCLFYDSFLRCCCLSSWVERERRVFSSLSDQSPAPAYSQLLSPA